MPKVLAALLAAPLLVVPLVAQTRVDSGVAARIRAEAYDRSQVMRTIEVLTDRYGPRLTGSPSLEGAGRWAVETLEAWGLTNGRLEPWEFGRPGWVNERLSAHIVSPVQDPLTAEVLAWTPGTQGPVRAGAILLMPPPRPTRNELDDYLTSMAGKVGGRIVLVGGHMPAVVTMFPSATRRDDDAVRAQFDPDRPARRPRGPRVARGPMSSAEVDRRIDEFLRSRGALVRVNDARREHGQIIAFHNPTFDLDDVLPTVVLRNEDYGRIARLLASGTPVELEVDITNRLIPEGRTAHNVVAEIQGTDLSHEVVMLGGHLDSWHAATGATDNAVGCAVMMEAVRILKVLGLQPRRTIRVALWSGEEQGLLGSRAYVARHFGTAEQPAPDFDRLVAYLNVDNGTGRLRGATVFGPRRAADMLRDVFSPMADLGLVGAGTTESRNFGSTDSTVFNHAGLPGINFTQDPIQYETHTHHTNLDTYERVLEGDVKAAVAVIAAVVYDLATRDERLPRFTSNQMPPPPGR